MKMARYLLLPLLFVFALLLPVQADSDASRIAEALADRLADALDFEGDTVPPLSFAVPDKLLAGPGDWEDRQLRDYLYHLRRRSWQGFFWQVNTSRREVYRVTGATFGKLGGEHAKTNIVLQPVGNAEHPIGFVLEIPNVQLSYGRSSRKAEINSPAATLADWDLEVREIYPYLYHIRTRLDAKGAWFWKVNTSRREVYRNHGGKFGALGGRDDPDRTVNLQVNGKPENPTGFALRFAYGYIKYR